MTNAVQTSPVSRMADALPDMRHRRIIGSWLALVALLVVAMVVLGGVTRMTDSGLSIVEWKPLTGAVPPFTEAQWLAEFEKYKLIPQYQLLNHGMSLAEFQFIYWWEWSHRLLGRLIGVVFALPLALFWWRGWLNGALKVKLLGLLALGGSQGALGWWMVASGLSQRTDVSQYRLAMHMTLAAIILSAIVWVAAALDAPARRLGVPKRQRIWIYLLPALVLGQIFLGGLVAGLDAGLSYNTWPLMDGRFIPQMVDLYVMQPAWVNHFENALTVQFQHRLLAYAIAALAIWQAFALFGGQAAAIVRQRGLLVVTAVALQVLIGVTTVLLSVPLWAGLLHQLCGIVLLIISLMQAALVWNDPEPERA